MLGVSGQMGTTTTTTSTTAVASAAAAGAASNNNSGEDDAATAAAVAASAEGGEAAVAASAQGCELQQKQQQQLQQGGLSEEDKGGIEEGERGGGGNRWPRQETLALLKIRSDMDGVFRDSSLKGPLWEQVSRKMAELGYHRSSKKCKEKFENVYKYHKRTRDGRSAKPDGKTYRFFDQLEALENITSLQLHPPPPSQQQQLRPPQPALAATPMQAVQVTTVSSTPNNNINVAAAPPQNFSNLITSSFPPSSQTTLLPTPQTTAAAAAANVTMNTSNTNNNPPPPNNNNSGGVNLPSSLWSNSTFSSSSSTSSDEDIERRHKRKRKWKDFFERLMKDVIEKQEELQKKFLETLEKRERDRMIREEAWRVQEVAKINREHDLLVQERSMAAARESALISFLQKMTDQQQQPQQQQQQHKNTKTRDVNHNTTPPPPPPQPQPQSQSQSQLQHQIIQVTTLPENPLPTPPPALQAPAPPPPAQVIAPQPIRSVETTPRSDNGSGGESFMGATSSRWPKAEVEALINLRTNLDNKYQENSPKGPLWEEISAGMRRLGYNRNAKRCKEKWENINKYFKKVKESNKKRPEDSKTCPYFHQLDALYKEKAKSDPSPYHPGVSAATAGVAYANPGKPEDSMVPIMARPEQQWPLPSHVVQQQQQQHQHQHQHHQHESSGMEEHEGDNMDDDDDDDDEEDEDEGSGYEIVTNKAQV